MQDTVPRGVDVRDIERSVAQLQGLAAARIVTDNAGHIVEVHALADCSRTPKQIIRDIESLLAAQWDIKIDHRKIGVAQLQDEEESARKDILTRRLKIRSVNLSVSGPKAEARVLLELSGKVYEGLATGVSSSMNRPRLVCGAALTAVEAFLRVRHIFVADEIFFVSLAGMRIAVVSVTVLANQGEERLVGGSVVRGSDYEAIVKATLDAVNRRLGFLRI